MVCVSRCLRVNALRYACLLSFALSVIGSSSRCSICFCLHDLPFVFVCACFVVACRCFCHLCRVVVCFWLPCPFRCLLHRFLCCLFDICSLLLVSSRCCFVVVACAWFCDWWLRFSVVGVCCLVSTCSCLGIVYSCILVLLTVGGCVLFFVVVGCFVLFYVVICVCVVCLRFFVVA